MLNNNNNYQNRQYKSQKTAGTHCLQCESSEFNKKFCRNGGPNDGREFLSCANCGKFFRFTDQQPPKMSLMQTTSSEPIPIPDRNPPPPPPTAPVMNDHNYHQILNNN